MFVATIVFSMFTLSMFVISILAIRWIHLRATAERWRITRAQVRTAVHSAEQIYRGRDMGEIKLRYVISRLESIGVKLDGKLIIDLIEEAVWEVAAVSESERVALNGTGCLLKCFLSKSHPPCDNPKQRNRKAVKTMGK